MQRNWIEVLSGAVVLIVAISFAVIGFQRAGLGARGQSYMLRASFLSVEGISEGTDVRMAGVKVGNVIQLQLNPETFRADAVVSVDNNIKIPGDSIIVIASEGLLGGNFVEIQPGGSTFNLEEGEEFVDAQGAVSLTNLLIKFASGSGSKK